MTEWIAGPPDEPGFYWLALRSHTHPDRPVVTVSQVRAGPVVLVAHFDRMGASPSEERIGDPDKKQTLLPGAAILHGSSDIIAHMPIVRPEPPKMLP